MTVPEPKPDEIVIPGGLLSISAAEAEALKKALAELRASLRPICCPAIRRTRSGTRLCQRVLCEVPESWGEAIVRALDGREQVSGSGLVRHCASCGTWVEITFREVANDREGSRSEARD